MEQDLTQGSISKVLLRFVLPFPFSCNLRKAQPAIMGQVLPFASVWLVSCIPSAE